MDRDQDAIWVELPEGGLLKDLFGHWPSFHEAAIKTISFDPGADEVRILVRYVDEGEGDKDLVALIELIWTGIAAFDLPVDAPELMGLSFARFGDQIRTEIEMGAGRGRIVSSTVDAEISKLDPYSDAFAEGPVRLIYGRRA